MSRITVLGGTGYAGSAIVREAAGRGHQVTSFSRRLPEEPAPGVRYATGSALNSSALADAAKDAEIIVVALASTGELEDRFAEVTLGMAELAKAAGARLGVVGGAGSLLTTADGPTVFDTPQFPKAFRKNSLASDAVLQALRGSDPELDWFVLSPPFGFGAYAPGAATGQYRVGGDVLLTDPEGRSEISGADFARAFVDEIESPAHVRTRFTVAY